MTASFSPRRGCLRGSVLTLLAVLAAGCISGTPTAPVPAHTPPAPTVTRVTVGGGSTGNPGQTIQMSATALYSDGNTRTVTQEATWSSGNTAVATVTAAGAVTFVALGEAEIRASFQEVFGTTRVTVAPAPVQRRALTGRVIDGGRRDGLPNARVDILDGADAGRSTNAGADGSFTLDNIAEGTFTMRFSHTGFDPVQQPVTHGPNTRVEVTLRPLIDVSSLYATYGITFNVRQQNCSTIVFPGPTGQISLRGNPDGSDLTVTVTERGASRDYRGTMNPDGSFGGSGSGVILGFGPNIRPHDFSGSIQGRVTGTSISGTESMTYGAPCPGGTVEIGFEGGR